jgi:hypothetical protein
VLRCVVGKFVFGEVSVVVVVDVVDDDDVSPGLISVVTGGTVLVMVSVVVVADVRLNELELPGST